MRPTARGILCTLTVSIAMTLPTTTALSAGAPGPQPPPVVNKAPADAAMESTYQRLAERAVGLYRSGKGTGLDGRCWIGVAGGPGAGKSTLAAAVADCINGCKWAAGEGAQNNSNSNSKNEENASPKAVAVPMDGYHYTRAKLAEISQTYEPSYDDDSMGMSRRGAPWTFDAEALALDLAEAKRAGSASLPEYDRVLSDPVEDAVRVEPSHKIVIVEGNYLLLGLLEAELDGDGSIGSRKPVEGSNLSGIWPGVRAPFPVGQEIGRWKKTAELWDETWFVSPPDRCSDHDKKTAVEIQRDRIIERSLETWTDSKTKAWGGGTDREAAVRRAEFNDVPNARLVNCCRTYADVIVDSI